MFLRRVGGDGSAQAGDAVGRRATGGRGGAAELGGDVRVRQPGDVVQDHRGALLVGEGRDGGAQLVVGEVGVEAAGVRDVGRRGGATGAGAQLVERLAVGDRHEPAADVAVRTQAGIRPHGGQERLGPCVVGVGGGEQGPAHAHHDRPVLAHDVLERSHRPMMSRRRVTARSHGP